MAHFAQIDAGVSVSRVLVVPDDQEHRGETYLADDLGLGGVWLQCSYNGTMRQRFPGVGWTYDSANDWFVAPRPFPSWTLDAAGEWQPPTVRPADGVAWDEESLSWVTA